MFLSVYSKNQPHENLSKYNLRNKKDSQTMNNNSTFNLHNNQQKKASDAFLFWGIIDIAIIE